MKNKETKNVGEADARSSKDKNYQFKCRMGSFAKEDAETQKLLESGVDPWDLLREG